MAESHVHQIDQCSTCGAIVEGGGRADWEGAARLVGDEARKLAGYLANIDAQLTAAGIPQNAPTGERVRMMVTQLTDLRTACAALFDAPHPDHFASRLGDEELSALNTIRAIVKGAS